MTKNKNMIPKCLKIGKKKRIVKALRRTVRRVPSKSWEKAQGSNKD